MKLKFNLKSPMPPFWLINTISWCIEKQEQYKILFPAPALWKHFYNELNNPTNFKQKEPYLFQYHQYQTEFWQTNGKPKYSLPDLKIDYKKKEQLKYIFFWGHHPSKNGLITKSCFSQWWIADFSVQTTTYCCMEQYMMAEKARLFEDKETEIKIINSKSPNQIKNLGRKVKNFNEVIWNKVKYTIVLTRNYYKFMQNPLLKQFLLNTNNRIIVEASPYDKIWGIQMAETAANIENPLQ